MNNVPKCIHRVHNFRVDVSFFVKQNLYCSVLQRFKIELHANCTLHKKRATTTAAAAATMIQRNVSAVACFHHYNFSAIPKNEQSFVVHTKQ